MKNWTINPEILSQEPTHIFKGVKVKVFKSTCHGDVAIGEIMEGEDKGKLTTLCLSQLVALKGEIK